MIVFICNVEFFSTVLKNTLGGLKEKYDWQNTLISVVLISAELTIRGPIPT